MKKWVIRLSIALVILIVLVVVAIGLFLDGAIKRGVETIGPKLAKVEVKLEHVNLSLLSGSGKIKGLLVGNPAGFKTPSAINVGSASLALQPGSIFSDKVIIKSVNVQGPEITFETDLKGNNLSKILANLQEATGGSQAQQPAQSKEAGAAKKLQVDDFLISGGKVHVSVTPLGGKSVTVPLPDIHLTDLGKGPEGITPAELTKKVLQAIEKESVKASGSAVADLGKQAADLTKGLTQDLGKGASGAVEKATKGIGDLFKKK
ncbi:MAG TPA: AsmA family protein [Bacillota bacterium]|nr:AsmA family protein [Bacillota bacterium]